MNSFQSIILGIFGLFIIAGLLVIATAKSREGDQRAALTLWGSRSEKEVNEVLRYFFENNDLISVSYREIPETELDRTTIEAIATGQGPDMLLLPLELLLRYRDKILLVPYANVSERDFRDTYIQEADLFLLPGGIAAFPYSLDPLVMYWNRDFLDDAGIATAPKFWDEFLLLANGVTRKDTLGNISRSAVALGEFRNIASAKEILSTLLLQSGSILFGVDESGSLRGYLNNTGAASVLDFYTEFANPQKPIYSWNRSLSDSRSAFLASRLAVYFGFGSEYTELKKGNPNLNFDVALFPRPRDAAIGITYGKLTGIAILRTTGSPSVALQVASALSSQAAAARLHELSGLPPVHRALLGDKPTDAFGAVMFDSATRARGFLDPDPARTKDVFLTMVESITSGRSRSGEALSRANQELETIAR